MDVKISPARQVTGEITVPGDKSISHRAAILGALAEGETVIRNFLRADDCLATLNCLRQLGVAIEENQETVRIKGRGLSGLKAPARELDCGNSGTTLRLLLGVLAGQNFTATLTGDASLNKRPMARVAQPLTRMGAKFWPGVKAEGPAFELKTPEKNKTSGQAQPANKNDLYPPLTIKGSPLRPIDYKLPVASAQVKSAILLAGLYAEGQTCVTEPAPSRNHTEKMLAAFGAKIVVEDLTVRLTGPATLSGQPVTVPGDFSSAAFFIVAALLADQGRLLIKNVGVNPTRTGLLEVLKKMGAQIYLKNYRSSGGEPSADLLVENSALAAAQVGGGIIPSLIDEIPVLAVAATAARGRTIIKDARELRVKESDRLAALSSELAKLGARIEERDDGLIIDGPTKLSGAAVRGHGDHRVAMALAVAGLSAGGQTIISQAEGIATSFPDFLKLLTAAAK